jgi:galactokinase
MKRHFSAPGRIEICGNHTDHQRGRVLAAAINLEATAVAEANSTNIIRMKNANIGNTEIDISTLEPRHEETGTTASLARGVASWFAKKGHQIGGFDAEITSNIPIGAGLSSSAAIEVLIGNILKGLYGAQITKMEIAQAGQYAENVYFGKPSGLMDQTASSYGGFNIIDFKNIENPTVTPVEADFNEYNICIVDTGGSHADLTPDYAACTQEMKLIAEHFGKKHLRNVNKDEFHSSIKNLRHLGDRAILRAIHFFNDHERVLKQADALRAGNMERFMQLVIESGNSSLAYLQNTHSPTNPQEQSLTLALALSEKILKNKGAWRVHGGGFAGTILAFVPNEKKDQYQKEISKTFGTKSCHYLKISQHGGREIIRE